MATELVGDHWGQPGGNFTGLMVGLNGTSAKRLEVLSGAFPAARRIGVLGDKIRIEGIREEIVEAAKVLGLEIIFLAFFGADERNAGLETLGREGVDVVMTTAGISESQGALEIRAWAEATQIPVLWYGPSRVERGGLVSFSQSNYLLPKTYTEMRVEYVVEILNGAAIAEPPLQVIPPVLAINLNTARDQSIKFPPHILALAEVVIELADAAAADPDAIPKPAVVAE